MSMPRGDQPARFDVHILQTLNVLSTGGGGQRPFLLEYSAEQRLHMTPPLYDGLLRNSSFQLEGQSDDRRASCCEHGALQMLLQDLASTNSLLASQDATQW